MDIVLERMLSLIPRKADGKFVHGALKEFANSIGLKSGNLVSDWMNGRSNSYQNYVYTVAAVYGVSADWLYGRDDNPDKKEKPDLREEIGPNKAKLLEETADMSEAEQAMVLEYIQKIKGLRG